MHKVGNTHNWITDPFDIYPELTCNWIEPGDRFNTLQLPVPNCEYYLKNG